jgi:hypothetical protein
MKKVEAKVLYNPFTEMYGLPDFTKGVIEEVEVPRVIRDPEDTIEELRSKYPDLKWGNYELVLVTVTHIS